MNFMLQKVCNTYISGNTHTEDLSKRIKIDDNVIFNSRSNAKESLKKKEKVKLKRKKRKEKRKPE